MAATRKVPMKSVYLIDASIFIFRAYFSIPETMVDPQGAPINAVYGFATFLCRVLEEAQPTHLAVAFDESLTTSFRNDVYPEYKANRELPPEDLEAQLRSCRELTEALGLAPNSAAVQDTHGWVLHLNGRSTEGLASIKAAHNAAPDDAAVICHLGLVSAAVGGAGSARAQLERCVALDPDPKLSAAARRLL